jgi:thiamine biosynthesis protein ThiS
MTFTLNGKANSDFDESPSVAQLLESLGLAGGGPVLVELDGIALRPREFAENRISDGAKVEIIKIAAGG